MRRFQLIEILDQPWCPGSVRDALTDYLQFSITLHNPYQAIIPRLAAAFEATNTSVVVDLCAGAGGPWNQLRPDLEQLLSRSLRLILTDRFPHQPTESPSPEATSTVLMIGADARSIPIGVPVFRTIFAGFHHFAPHDARMIIQDAVKQRHGIAIFEATQRSFPAMFLISVSAVGLLLTTPFIRPWRWSRILWTYIIPVAPLLLIFDGVVSCLRTYTPDELREIIASIEDESYVWEVGAAPISGTPLAATYVIGYPKSDTHRQV